MIEPKGVNCIQKEVGFFLKEQPLADIAMKSGREIAAFRTIHRMFAQNERICNAITQLFFFTAYHAHKTVESDVLLWSAHKDKMLRWEGWQDECWGKKWFGKCGGFGSTVR